MTIDFPGVTRRSLAWIILLLVCASGGGWARRVVEQEPTRIAPPRAVTMRPEIVGSYGIVAGGRHYSVAAGVSERQATEAFEWSKRTYYPDGRVCEVGEIFRQPNLAKTLRAIVATERSAFERTRDRAAAIRAGRDAFYTGEIARRIAYSMSTGVVAVGVDPKTGALRGGADPRRERYIFGW